MKRENIGAVAELRMGGSAPEEDPDSDGRTLSVDMEAWKVREEWGGARRNGNVSQGYGGER